jgi:hypothetical protein
LTLATFWFDGGTQRVQGWTDGATWNNWGVPMFDERQLPAAIRALSEVGYRVKRLGRTLQLIDLEAMAIRVPPSEGTTDYPAETHNGRRFWRIEGLTWNYEPSGKRPYSSAARGKRVREASDLTLKGWSVGYHDEISAHAAVRQLPGQDDVLFVMTSDDREPRSRDEDATVGLYFFNGDSWEQIAYADFPDVASVIKLNDAELQLIIEHALSMDQARDLLVEEFEDWDTSSDDVSIMSWMATIMRDAGVEMELAGAYGVQHEAIEQILNASPAQILAYMNERAEAINE